MKIKKEDFDKFYFGESNEKYIQSEFYAQGYEALKNSPDIGYDLLVTNCARTKFMNEEPRQYNIQVKSRPYYDNSVYFFIKKEEFEYLLDDINGYLICVFCKPLISYGKEDIEIFRESMVSDCENHMIESYMENLLTEDKQYITLEKLKDIQFVEYEHEYIWFNNAQLKRLREEKLIYENLEYVYIYFSKKSNIPPDDNNEYLELVDKNNEPYSISSNDLYNTTMIGYEQQHIKYLVECDVKDNTMFKGDIYI